MATCVIPWFAVNLPEAISRRCYACSHNPISMTARYWPLAEAERIFVRMGLYPDYRIYVAVAVAVAGGRVVGSFALLIMDNLAHLGARSAVIEDVAVDPVWQGRGVGKSMMRFALRLCGEKGCYKALLSSNLKRGRAHAFYGSLDFERHGYSFRVEVPTGD
jgi:GNAT superfamily N-acetyltransferase